MVGLESHRGVEHRLLQQAALRAERIGVDAFPLEAEGHVEDVDVLRAAFALRRGWRAGEHGDRGSGQLEKTTSSSVHFRSMCCHMRKRAHRHIRRSGLRGSRAEGKAKLAHPARHRMRMDLADRLEFQPLDAVHVHPFDADELRRPAAQRRMQVALVVEIGNPGVSL